MYGDFPKHCSYSSEDICNDLVIRMLLSLLFYGLENEDLEKLNIYQLKYKMNTCMNECRRNSEDSN
jgi:hypothetical protein